jgi:hypothetical protein
MNSPSVIFQGVGPTVSAEKVDTVNHARHYSYSLIAEYIKVQYLCFSEFKCIGSSLSVSMRAQRRVCACVRACMRVFSLSQIQN